MKKVLILILSSDIPPYKEMLNTSLKTWDVYDVENVETVFYIGQSQYTHASEIKNVYQTNVVDGFWKLGYKMIEACKYALKNKEFDYVFRTHSSTYIHKRKLLEYVQNRSAENLCLGLSTPMQEIHKDKYGLDKYMWGGSGYLLSRDVVQKIVDNSDIWDHALMEDMAMSIVLNRCGVPFISTGRFCAVHPNESGYNIITYDNGLNGGAQISDLAEFNTHNDLKNQFAFRLKQDGKRELDIILMNELYKKLEA